MTPQEFVAKWRPGTPSHARSERAGAQPHFIDLPDDEILRRLLALNRERAGAG